MAFPNSQGNDLFILENMNTREHDLQHLREAHAHSTNKRERELIVEAGNKIKKESGLVRSMRESLLKEHRKGKTDNVKEIHEYIKGKDKYQNE